MSLLRRLCPVASRRVAITATSSSSSSLAASSASSFTHAFRPVPCVSVSSFSSSRYFSTDLNAARDAMTKANPSIDIPHPDGVERPSERVNKIVADIMALNMMEGIQLGKALQKAMGLEGFQVMGGGGGGGAAPAAAAPAAAAKPVEEKKPAAEEKTTFSIRLDSFDAKDKIKVIKEVRTATGLGLKESKDLVEGAPKTIKKDLNKADAEALVAKMKEAGAKCSLE